MAHKTAKLRVKRTSPVEDVTSEIDVHGPMIDGKFEFVIQQTIHDNFKKRYKPGKLVIFSLSPEEFAQLAAVAVADAIEVPPIKLTGRAWKG